MADAGFWRTEPSALQCLHRRPAETWQAAEGCSEMASLSVVLSLPAAGMQDSQCLHLLVQKTSNTLHDSHDIPAYCPDLAHVICSQHLRILKCVLSTFAALSITEALAEFAFSFGRA